MKSSFFNKTQNQILIIFLVIFSITTLGFVVFIRSIILEDREITSLNEHLNKKSLKVFTFNPHQNLDSLIESEIHDKEVIYLLTNQYHNSFRPKSILLIIYFFSLFFGSLLLLYLFLRYRMSKPMKKIIQALQEENPLKLKPLTEQHSEYGTIANSLNKFLQQSSELKHEIVQRKKAEEILNKKNAADGLLASLSASLINLSLDEFPIALNKVLEDVGKFTQSDRCKIFLAEKGLSKIISVEFEWCAEGVPSSLSATITRSLSDDSLLMKEFLKGDIILVDDITAWDLPDSVIKDSLIEQQVISIAVLPMIYKDDFYGFISFQYLKPGMNQAFDKVHSIKNIGDIFINATINHNKNLKLQEYSQQLEGLLQDTSNDLLASEQLHQAVFDNVNDGIVISDIKGTVINANDVFLKYLDFTKQELIEMDTRNLVAPAPGFNAQDAIEKILDKGSGIFELAVFNKKGEKKTSEVNSSVIEFKSEKVLLSVFRDITERKKAEEEKRLLWAAVINSPNGIVITDKEGAIQYVNDAYLELTGYKLEELLGKSSEIFRSGKMSDTFYKDFYKQIATGKVWNGRLTNRKKDNSLFNEDMTIFCIKNNEGEITNYISIKRDITDQVQMESEIKRSEKLQAIGTLASFIAHDFNSILQIIQIYSDLISIESDVNPEVKKHLEPINTSIHRGKELIQSILTYNKHSDDELKPQNFKLVVEEAIVFLNALVPSTIILNTKINDVGSVNCNVGKIHQILMNLLSNSLDAITQDGVITISLKKFTNPVVNQVQLDGDWSMLSFKDNGSGMDELTLKNIFNPFYTTKKRGMGSGIGVPKILNIMQFHNGYIEIESELGKGSCFKLYFQCV